MQRIDDSLLITIFELLRPQDLLVCSQVCKQWKVCACDGLLWKRHCKPETAKNTSQDFKALFLKQQRKLYELRAGKITHTYSRKHLKDIFTKVQIVAQIGIITSDRNRKQGLYNLSSDDTNIFNDSICYRWWDEVSSLDIDVGKVEEIIVYLGVPLVFKAQKDATGQGNTCYPIESCHWWKRLVLSPKDAVKVCEDNMIDVYGIDCVSFALWKGTKTLAFLTATFHSYKMLVEDVIKGGYRDTPSAARQLERDLLIARDYFRNNNYDVQCYLTIRNYRKEYLRCVWMKCDLLGSRGDGCRSVTGMDFGSEIIENSVELLWRTTNFKNKIPMVCIVDISLLTRGVLLADLSQVAKLTASQPDVTDYTIFGDEVFKLSVNGVRTGLNCELIFVRIDEGYLLHSIDMKVACLP